MAINLSKIKAALDNYENPKSSGGGRNDKLFRLDPGDDEDSAVIKLVPYKYAPEDPFLELHFHYGLAGKNFLCPRKMHGRDCDVCTFGFEMLNKFKETKNKEYQEPLQVLLPKSRIYIPVVRLDGDEDPVVKLWGFSPTVHKKLLTYAFQFGEANIDITDPLNSPEFTVTTTSAKKNGSNYSSTEIDKVEESFQTKFSALADSQKEINAILDTCPDIFSIYEEKSDEELYEALEKHLKENLQVDLSGGKEEIDNGTEKDFSGGTEEKVEESAEENGSASYDDLDLDNVKKDFENMLDK
jgi:hypothetical protein